MKKAWARNVLFSILFFSILMFFSSEAHANHWIEKVADGGKIIILEDRSVWEVSPIDSIHSSLWLPVSRVIVVTNSGFYPYLMINLSDKRAVEVKFLGNLK